MPRTRCYCRDAGCGHLAARGARPRAGDGVLLATSSRAARGVARRNAPRRASDGTELDGAVTIESPRMRQEYSRHGLAEDELAPDRFTQFAAWLAEMVAAGLSSRTRWCWRPRPATAAPAPARCCSRGGRARFTFFTNYGSRKATRAGRQPVLQPGLPVVPGGRQVVVCGPPSGWPRAESEAYFATRPRGRSSAPGQPAVAGGRRPGGARRPRTRRRAPLRADGRCRRPPHWGGLRVVPETVEFWQGRTGRMHDRLRYRRTPDGSAWLVERLGP